MKKDKYAAEKKLLKLKNGQDSNLSNIDALWYQSLINQR